MNKSDNIKILTNNLDLLKTFKSKKQIFNNKVLYILGSASIERSFIKKIEYFKFINEILKKNKKKKNFLYTSQI